MKGLLKYLKDYKVESVLGPLFKMLEASFELFVPLVVASMIDIGIRNQDTGYILKMAGVLVLLAAIGLACYVDPACNDRSVVFDHRTVFCSKGGGRIFYCAEKCAVCPY